MGGGSTKQRGKERPRIRGLGLDDMLNEEHGSFIREWRRRKGGDDTFFRIIVCLQRIVLFVLTGIFSGWKGGKNVDWGNVLGSLLLLFTNKRITSG